MLTVFWLPGLSAVMASTTAHEGLEHQFPIRIPQILHIGCPAQLIVRCSDGGRGMVEVARQCQNGVLEKVRIAPGKFINDVPVRLIPARF